MRRRALGVLCRRGAPQAVGVRRSRATTFEVGVQSAAPMGDGVSGRPVRCGAGGRRTLDAGPLGRPRWWGRGHRSAVPPDPRPGASPPVGSRGPGRTHPCRAVGQGSGSFALDAAATSVGGDAEPAPGSAGSADPRSGRAPRPAVGSREPHREGARARAVGRGGGSSVVCTAATTLDGQVELPRFCIVGRSAASAALPSTAGSRARGCGRRRCLHRWSGWCGRRRTSGGGGRGLGSGRRSVGWCSVRGRGPGWCRRGRR